MKYLFLHEMKQILYTILENIFYISISYKIIGNVLPLSHTYTLEDIILLPEEENTLFFADICDASGSWTDIYIYILWKVYIYKN